MVSRARVMRVLACALIAACSCSGKKQTREPDAELSDGSDCGPDCGPADLCIRGVCEKNPFLTGTPGESVEEVETRATCPYPESEIPPVEQFGDRDIPQFDAKKKRVVDMRKPSSSGSGKRLSDAALDQHLEAIHSQLVECIDIGACYSEETLSGGDFSFRFSLAGSGKVTAVSVDVSPQLSVAPIVACARRALWDVRFPSFKGTMTATYEVTIE